MKKMVFKLPIEDEKRKRKALKLIAWVIGVDSVTVYTKESKITVVGEADPVIVTTKLRKFGFGCTELLTVGPAKEQKKEDEKKDAKEQKNPEPPRVVYVHRPYEYSVVSDENTNACTIC